MIIGPKYKIARRLGAPIFEKTQTQKYALRLERKGKKRGFSKAKSEYGLQMNEKQKARFTYGISEKQFSNYVKEAIAKKTGNAPQLIFEFLELRLDNVLYRLGFAPTRLAGRQMASHGHISLNGKKVNIPSARLSIGDKISVTNRSTQKVIFEKIEEKTKEANIPSWIKFDFTKKVAEIQSKPQMVKTENTFNLNDVVEFYSR